MKSIVRTGKSLCDMALQGLYLIIKGLDHTFTLSWQKENEKGLSAISWSELNVAKVIIFECYESCGVYSRNAPDYRHGQVAAPQLEMLNGGALEAVSKVL
jgi:hypothetical protein